MAKDIGTSQKEATGHGASGDPIVGYGLADHLSVELVRRAARSNCTILLTGETGVGKGHLAKWVHAASTRADGPMIPVNCGAIPDTLVDSQLFGHRRGAFSGATADHVGLIRAADSGTLFLDEVSELPASAQTRLLRLLQEKEVQPVGAPGPVTVDVRIIAATNVELNALVADRRFREDLLYRLDVIRVPVKPLRDRRDEIVTMIELFNAEMAQTYRQKPVSFDDDAIQRMLTFDWPGNVRQLRTVIERLHVLCPDETVSTTMLRAVGQMPRDDEPEHPQDAMARLKKDMVDRVLEESGGSVSEAAARYGVHRSTIYRWMRGQD